jgi:hypothetical protein
MEVFVIFEDVYELDDVRVVHGLQDLDLSLQSFQATHFRFFDRLHSEIIFGLAILTFSDNTIVSMTELAMIHTIFLTN